jgi:hypothetical protein
MIPIPLFLNILYSHSFILFPLALLNTTLNIYLLSTLSDHLHMIPISLISILNILYSHSFILFSLALLKTNLNTYPSFTYSPQSFLISK